MRINPYTQSYLVNIKNENKEEGELQVRLNSSTNNLENLNSFQKEDKKSLTKLSDTQGKDYLQ